MLTEFIVPEIHYLTINNKKNKGKKFTKALCKEVLVQGSGKY